jgi:hypothetical protein
MPSKVKVLFDQSHDEEHCYSLIEKLEDKVDYEINENILTYEKLKNFDVLILNSPKKVFSGKEKEDIKVFLKRGGRCVLTDAGESVCNSLEILPGVFKLRRGYERFDYFCSPDQTPLREFYQWDVVREYVEERCTIQDIAARDIKIFLSKLTSGIKSIREIKREDIVSFLGREGNFVPLFQRILKFPLEASMLKEELERYARRKLYSGGTSSIPSFSDEFCRKVVEHYNRKLTEEYGMLGVASHYGSGRIVALASDLFCDPLVEQDTELDSNLRFFLNAIGYFDESTILKKDKSEKIFPFIY